MKILDILSAIDNNQLFVPAFQREYVWKKDNVKNLFDSLIKGYPFGTMLTWSTNSPPKMKGSVVYNNKMGAIKLILDGQQRITSLYLIIKGKIPPYYKYIEANDPRNLYVNLKNGELQYYKEKLMEKNPLWVKLSEVFDSDTILVDLLQNKDLQDSSANIARIHGKIKGILQTEFIEQIIPIEASVKEAIDIFYTVNSGGITLTDAELALAQISGYWEDARDTFKKKISELHEKGYKFKLDFIVYVLLAVMYQSGDEMKKLHGADNKEKMLRTWELLNKYALDYVVNILKDKAFVSHTDEINSVYALIPIIVYFCKKFEHNEKSFNNEEIKKIVRWFYYSQIRNRYVSQLPQKLSKDSRIAWNSENPFDELLMQIEEERSLKITENEFEGRNISHPLFRLCIFYFKSKGAVCLTTNISINMPMGKNYKLEKDHIFPYSLLKTMGFKMGDQDYRLAQEFTNRAILTQTANREKSSKPAEKYLSTIKKDALELQSIPTDPYLWKIENYKGFLAERRKILAEQLNNFLDNFSKTETISQSISVDSLIEQGESDELEFKETFRWNIEKHRVDQEMERAILKTICAFTNSDGGTLLIGVHDNGSITGLEFDYENISKQDRDGFELMLRNSISNAFGTTFASRFISLKFYVLDDKDICKVNIKKSNELIFIESKDKNGQKKKEAFIRVGNSSKALEPDEIVSYAEENFTSKKTN